MLSPKQKYINSNLTIDTKLQLSYDELLNKLKLIPQAPRFKNRNIPRFFDYNYNNYNNNNNN